MEEEEKRVMITRVVSPRRASAPFRMSLRRKVASCARHTRV